MSARRSRRETSSWRDAPARSPRRSRSSAAPCRAAVRSVRPAGALLQARKRIVLRFHSPLDGQAELARRNRDHTGFEPVALGENHLKTVIYWLWSGMADV